MRIKEMLTKPGPAGSGGMGIVDVRDVALAHIRAFEQPGAQGRYLIASGSLYWVRNMGNIPTHSHTHTHTHPHTHTHTHT